MRVVFAIDQLGSGGAQRQITELAIRLRAEGQAETSVLVYHPHDFFGPVLKQAGVPVARIPRASRFDPRLPGRIRRYLRDEGVEIVHAFLWPTILWCLLAAKGLPKAERPRLIAAERSALRGALPQTQPLQRLLYLLSDAVSVNSTAALEEIHARYRVPRERLHYIPNGIDLAAWDAASESPAPLELEPADFHLALVGGLRPEKNHALLFEALARLGPEGTRGWRVWCVGGRTAGAAAARRIEAEIGRRGLEDIVRLVPPVRELASLLRRMDALVLCSVYEGFPNVVLEAMASRLPVVATRVGDVPSLVAAGETGFLVEPGDAGGVAEALARLAALSAAERQALGRRGRERVEARFRMDAVAGAHLELYRALLGQ